MKSQCPFFFSPLGLKTWKVGSALLGGEKVGGEKRREGWVRRNDGGGGEEGRGLVGFFLDGWVGLGWMGWGGGMQ